MVKSQFFGCLNQCLCISCRLNQSFRRFYLFQSNFLKFRFEFLQVTSPFLMILSPFFSNIKLNSTNINNKRFIKAKSQIPEQSHYLAIRLSRAHVRALCAKKSRVVLPRLTMTSHCCPTDPNTTTIGTSWVHNMFK